MDAPITRAEHLEFAKRMEDEHSRQNHRISELEKDIGTLYRLTASVEQLASNMGEMVSEQKRQGERLDALEKKPADNWNTVAKAALGSIGSALGGALITFLIMILTK